VASSAERDRDGHGLERAQSSPPVIAGSVARLTASMNDEMTPDQTIALVA
jgi:hypothetical protein